MPSVDPKATFGSALAGLDYIITGLIPKSTRDPWDTSIFWDIVLSTCSYSSGKVPSDDDSQISWESYTSLGGHSK